MADVRGEWTPELRCLSYLPTEATPPQPVVEAPGEISADDLQRLNEQAMQSHPRPAVDVWRNWPGMNTQKSK